MRHRLLLAFLLATVGFSVAGFGAACLGFLWPTGTGGFGGKVGADDDRRPGRARS